jgi:hypothetical protein
MGRTVLARLHNPGNRACSCLPSCWCQRTKIGYAVRWYMPARFHRLPTPSGVAEAADSPDKQG